MDEQNKFYTSISKYYSEIFPYKPMQQKFVEKRVGELIGKRILDIGCATGELAFNLAERGGLVTGIDLNEDLLFQAKSNKKHENLKFQTGNMLELANDFNGNSLDAVLCFGNTLVHLPNKTLIAQMLEGVYQVLKPGGKYLMQILNYDYIVDKQLAELPLIDTKNVKFVRNYKFQPGQPLIRFQTNLEIKEENSVVSNETSLLALGSSELIELLEKSGFSEINIFSNFKMDSFGGNHLPLVLSCVK